MWISYNACVCVRACACVRVHNQLHNTFSANHKSSRITLSKQGRKATHTGLPRRHATAVGGEGYSSGVHWWRLRVTGLPQETRHVIAVGVTTLPVDRNDYNDFSRGSAYAWFSHQGSHGLAASQTRGGGPAEMTEWQNNDEMTLRLDCDRQLLSMTLHGSRREKKTIRMRHPGVKLYLYVYTYLPGNSVEILDQS